ncbi:MAG: hypothetical protein L0H59_15275 [Tomitella sp.]|nr:hypothetical protein [Tomitella sp.]
MTSLAPAAESTMFGILILTACLWIGGMVTVVFVARISSATLDPKARVAFFRAFGRAYGIFATVALLVGFVVGGVLLGSSPWTGLSTAIVVMAVALVVALAWGIVQARHMTRMRHTAAQAGEAGIVAAEAGAAAIDADVARRARSAAALRAGIGLLTLALFVLSLARWL